MLRDQVRDGVAEGLALDVAGQPRSGDGLRGGRSFLGRDRPKVEVGRRPAILGRSVLFEKDELKPLRDGSGLARSAGARVTHSVLEEDKQTGLLAGIRLVDEYA